MAIPVYKPKSHRITLESDPTKEVRFEEFTMAKQKPVITIRETNDNRIQQIKAIMDMVQSCIHGVDINDLYLLDFTKLFYTIRAISESSKIEFKATCSKCENENEIEISVSKDFDVINNEKENYVRRIKVDDSLEFELRALKVRDIFQIADESRLEGNMFFYDCIASSLTKIIHEDKIYYSEKEFKEESNTFDLKEAEQFIQSLPVKLNEEIIDYYQNMPSMKLNKEVACNNCGEKIDVGTSGGIDNFLF